MAKQYGFYIDTEHCTGCKACFVACKDRQNLADGEKFRRVFEFSGGSWVTTTSNGNDIHTHNTFAMYTSVSCNHCDDPACVAVCPADAYTKRESDGLVVYDGSKCISCFGCQEACPYGAPTYDYAAGYMKKCSMCMDETDANGVPDPACVKACPSRALDFGEISELRTKYGTVDNVPAFGNATKPNVVFRLHSDAVSSSEPVNPEEI